MKMSGADLALQDRTIAELEAQVQRLTQENLLLDPPVVDHAAEEALAAASAASAAAAKAEETKKLLGANHAFIGCYTTKQGHIKGDDLGEGVYSFVVNPDGSLTSTGPPISSVDPSFVCLSKDNKYLYATNEIDNYGVRPLGMTSGHGSLSSFKVGPGGSLSALNVQSTMGAATCHAQCTNKHVVCANYTGGSVCVFPIEPDGSLGDMSDFHEFEGTGPNTERQEKAHAHMSTIDGNFVFVPDLGSDKVRQFTLGEDGVLEENEASAAMESEPGAGPRHLAFHPSYQYAYVINELQSTVTACEYNKEKGTLNAVQNISALPKNYKKLSHCADIHVSPDGKFLYGSNRGHDSIVIFSINPDGKLKLVGHEPTQGANPRNFQLTPGGDFLLVANQDSHNIVTFKVDKNKGTLTDTGFRAHVGSPVCICLAAL